MDFDASRLRLGDQIAAVGAIVLFIVLFFFKWYGIGLGGEIEQLAKSVGVNTGSASWNGWHGHEILSWLALVTIVAALALAFFTATQRTIALPVTLAVITAGLALLLTVLLAYRVLINEPGPNDLVSVKLGAYLGLLSSGAILAGAYLAMRDEGTTLRDVEVQARAVGSQAKAAFDERTTSGGPRAS